MASVMGAGSTTGGSHPHSLKRVAGSKSSIHASASILDRVTRPAQDRRRSTVTTMMMQAMNQRHRSASTARASLGAGDNVRPTLAALMATADPVESLGGPMELSGSEAAEPVPVTAAVRRVTRNTISGVPAPALESSESESQDPAEDFLRDGGALPRCLMIAADLEYKSYINPESRAKRMW